MFKCKSCGRQFGANIPLVCPECGETIEVKRGAMALTLIFVGQAVSFLVGEIVFWIVLLMLGVGFGYLVYRGVG